jgi:hypothetical protein
VVFYGRTLVEYQQMFALDGNKDLTRLKGCKVLDCPSGPSSFVAEANKFGIDAIGCDPLYGDDIGALVRQGRQDIELVIKKISSVSHLYNWDFYRSPEGLKQYRESALNAFESDYSQGFVKGHYIKAKLPSLPFGENSFDLALSGNLLFYYSDQFDYSFHLDSILELCRIASDVRIYPVQGPYSHPYPHYDRLVKELGKRGITARTVRVAHHFQHGVDKMLHLTRN